jgi:hypothetical protein
MSDDPAEQVCLELRDMLHSISESYNSSSWPVGRETEILDWVEGGDWTAVPFDDRHEIVSPKFYERLRVLRRLLGGWLYFDHERQEVIFASEAEWKSLREQWTAQMWKTYEGFHGTVAFPKMRPHIERQRAEIRTQRIENARERLRRRGYQIDPCEPDGGPE